MPFKASAYTDRIRAFLREARPARETKQGGKQIKFRSVMRNRILALSLILISGVTVKAQQNSDDLLKAKLLTMQPPAMVALAQRLTAGHFHHTPEQIDVMFVRADLDGSGKFIFVVAFFFTAQGGHHGYLRVFRQDNGVLTVAGDEENPGTPSGGGPANIELVDVNGDGIPEIKVEGTGLSGAHTSFTLFAWTGSSLHLMTANDVDTGDASLVDIDGDGQLEIVAGPSVDFNDPGFDRRSQARLI